MLNKVKTALPYTPPPPSSSYWKCWKHLDFPDVRLFSCHPSLSGLPPPEKKHPCRGEQAPPTGLCWGPLSDKRKIHPIYFFKKLHVSLIILKRWKALSFQRSHLRLWIRRSQFYFEHGHWWALWIWINHLISLAPNLLLHKMRDNKYLTIGLESVLLKVKKQNLHRVSDMRKEGWPRNHQRSSTANIIHDLQGWPQKTRMNFRYSLATLPAS